MNTVLKWSAFGLIAYLVALVYTIPAHLVSPYLPAAVHIGRLSGTLWNAQATDFAFNDFTLSELTWRIRPFYLLIGNLKTSVDFGHTDMNGSGDIILGYRSLDLQDLNMSGSTAIISPFINTLGTSIDGKFDLVLESLEITHAGPQDAQGRLTVSDTRLTSPAELRIGDIEVDLVQQDDSAVATLKNTDSNVLKLSGTAKINPQWRYTTGVRIAPTDATPEAVRQTLTLLGRPDARGAVTMNQNGQIPMLRWLPYLRDSESVASSQ